MNNILIIAIFLVSFLILSAKANNDGNCCRKKIYCYECDSRFDPRCGDTFNLTRDTGLLVPCNDYCVKMKHIVDNKYHFLRTCADTLKEIYMKKTEVCYATRSEDKGSLCFCGQELCNSANFLLLNKYTKLGFIFLNFFVTSNYL